MELLHEYNYKFMLVLTNPVSSWSTTLVVAGMLAELRLVAKRLEHFLRNPMQVAWIILL